MMYKSITKYTCATMSYAKMCKLEGCTKNGMTVDYLRYMANRSSSTSTAAMKSLDA